MVFSLLLIMVLMVNSHIIQSSTIASSYPFISGHTFRAFCNHVLDQNSGTLSPDVIKNGDTIFLQTDPPYIVKFFSEIFPFIKNSFIIVSHYGDWSIPGLQTYLGGKYQFDLKSYLDSPKIIAWFAQNADIKHPKLTPIPIGFASRCWLHGDIENFKKAAAITPPLTEKKALVYLNWSLNTNPVRKKLMAYFEHKHFCYRAESKAHLAYLEEMKQYRYVLCPPGNGQDCHRFWEALLVGSIPIVQHSFLDDLYSELPVIFVHDWNEVTPDFLETEYKKVKNKKFNMNKIYIQYWFDLINDCKQRFLVHN